MNPRIEDYRIRDVAHSLAVKCRYGGHCTGFYSVAQHSVLVSRHVDPEHAMAGLLHDIDEAYSPFGDIPRPIKLQLPPEILAIGDRIQRHGFAAFGLPTTAIPDDVHRVDKAILWDEAVAFVSGGLTLPPRYPRLNITILQWSWPEAEAKFLQRFVELGGVI